MIEQAIILSLKITGIYLVFQQGMIFGWLRIIVANIMDRYFKKQWSTYLQKPLFSCLPCMAGLWTIALSQSFNPWMILIVCGILAIISAIID